MDDWKTRVTQIRPVDKPSLNPEQACLVLIAPVLLVAILFASGDEAVVREWCRLFAAMPLLGLITLILADRIAARVDA